MICFGAHRQNQAEIDGQYEMLLCRFSNWRIDAFKHSFMRQCTANQLYFHVAVFTISCIYDAKSNF